MTRDLDTVDDDVLDAGRFAVEATEPTGQIVAPTHCTLRHGAASKMHKSAHHPSAMRPRSRSP